MRSDPDVQPEIREGPTDRRSERLMHPGPGGIASGPSARQRSPRLAMVLRRALSTRSLRVLGEERLKANVYRVQVEVDGGERSLVVKRSQPEAARRNWLVACRWLPAVRLAGVGPPIVGVAADPDGEAAWHVYDELSGQPLSRRRVSTPDATAVLETIARVHTSLAGHPLLRECRLWGGDRGIAFYSGNVNDAISALRALDPHPAAREGRDALQDRLEGLRAQESERRQSLAACGGPETLLHGDLWTTNAILLDGKRAVEVRLVDWDEAAVGPVAFDLSTFLLQFDRARRRLLLRRYRTIVRRLAGWELAGDRALNAAFATAAYARLASLLVWTLAGAEVADGGWFPGRLADIADWLDDVEPVLPG